jgi:uncharacterized protein
MDELDRLTRLIRDRGKILVAFSGGVDSTLVALAARKAWGDQALAVMVENDTIPGFEVEEAARIATEIGIRLEFLKVDVLDDEKITSNNVNRCGLCKKKLMSLLLKMAWAKGFDTVADGTNADDVEDYRPGLEASDRLGIWHPLLESGIGKERTREILKRHSISAFDKPSTTCLMTRIPYGESITREKLTLIGEIEEGVRKAGLRDIRLRLFEANQGYIGILEVDDPSKALRKWKTISKHAKGVRLALDPRGYRQGSLNLEGLPP